MSNESPMQVINQPNALKLKLGGRFGGIDMAAIAKAEAALASLSSNFDQWMQDELQKLESSRLAMRVEGINAQTAENLYFRAHDLKGLGATYDFPLITRIAASLCRLIDDPATRQNAPMFLVDAHIDAIKAAVRDEIRTETHPVGKVLIAELESRVEKFIVGG